ncbi:MAG: sulfur carrier protein ThiS [Puniceicoccales bacterium]|jgi:sulfur carrier protein|nr:sulfur carrier protein ThiS [Puniceicoccales bacterium]
MLVHVNDEPKEVPQSATLAELVEGLALRSLDGVAVAVNEMVVPRRDWITRQLQDEDRLIIIHATQGG